MFISNKLPDRPEILMSSETCVLTLYLDQEVGYEPEFKILMKVFSVLI